MKKITLNPEIKEQADKLFKLIEAEVKKHHEDTVAEAMAEEWGNFLKTSKGYDMLEYGRDLTLTQSERAKLGLEESFYSMDDEAASLISKITENSLKVVELHNRNPVVGSDDFYRLKSRVCLLNRAATAIEEEISTLWMHRASSYRREIDELRKVS